MQKKRIFVRAFLTFLPLLIIAYTNGQSLVNCNGNTLKNNSYYFEYSIGEISIITIPGSTNNVTQGLLQPNIKRTPPPCDFMGNDLVGFENPTRNIVRIVGQFDWITNYKVYAADGKLVKQGTFVNNTIDLSKFPAAVYFIQLFPGCNGDFKVLKVLKEL